MRQKQRVFIGTMRDAQLAAIRRNSGKARRDDLAEGRRERAATFRPNKGAGSYRRRPKHRGRGWE